jgi:hypothetical protein
VGNSTRVCWNIEYTGCDLTMGNDQSDLGLLLNEAGTPMGVIVISWWDFRLRRDS